MRDVPQVNPAQANGLALDLSALAMSAARETLDGWARKTMRADAALLAAEAEAVQDLGYVRHGSDIIFARS
jgi:hypothetical protein